MTDHPPAALVTEALRAVVEDYGRRVAADPTRVRAMLSDVLGAQARDCRAEIDAVCWAADEGVAATIESRRVRVPSESESADEEAAFRESLAARGLGVELADVAVAAWTAALDRAGGSQAATQPASTRFSAAAAAAGSAEATQRANRGARTPWDPGAGSLPTSQPGADTVADPPQGRRRRFVVVAAVLCGVLALALGTVTVGLLWRGSNAAGGAHADAGHAGAAGAAVPDANRPDAPNNMPPMDHGAGATAPPSDVPPTGATRGTVPVPAAQSGPSLTAANSQVAFTPTITSGGAGECSEFAGTANLAWCSRVLDVAKGGEATQWTIVDVRSDERHGSSVVQGHRIVYTPYHNGPYVEHIHYRLRGGNRLTPVATLKLEVACNENYRCH